MADKLRLIGNDLYLGSEPVASLRPNVSATTRGFLEDRFSWLDAWPDAPSAQAQGYDEGYADGRQAVIETVRERLDEPTWLRDYLGLADAG